MKLRHLALALALATGLAACETAFSGPDAGRTAFLTGGAGGVAASAPDVCTDPAPPVPTARTIGDATALSDPAFSDEGC